MQPVPRVLSWNLLLTLLLETRAGDWDCEFIRASRFWLRRGFP